MPQTSTDLVQAGAEIRIDLFPGQQHNLQMTVGRSEDAAEAMPRLDGWAHPKLGP